MSYHYMILEGFRLKSGASLHRQRFWRTLPSRDHCRTSENSFVPEITATRQRRRISDLSRPIASGILLTSLSNASSPQQLR